MLKQGRIFLICIIALLCVAIVTIAQEGPAGAGRGAINRGMIGRGSVSSPLIASGNTVTFRISAPQATSVAVRGDFGSAGQMTKDEQGI